MSNYGFIHTLLYMMLSVATSGWRWRPPTLRCHRLISSIPDPNVLPPFIVPWKTSGQRASLRPLTPRRSMSGSPANDPEPKTYRQSEPEVKMATKRLRAKLKKDLETAKGFALHQVVNVPNVITAARILATPYLSYLIVQGDHTSAIGVLALAGVSDWLDGFVARTFHQESIIGSFLDPFADKLLIGTLSLSTMWTGLLPLPLAVLMLGRDGMLIGGTFYHRLKTKNESLGFFDTSDSEAFQVEPTVLSKVNTALQFSTFGLALTNAAWQMPPDLALTFLFGVTGSTTFLSGCQYWYGYVTKTGAFRPLSKTLALPLRKAVERTGAVIARTEAVVKHTKEVMRRPLKKTSRHSTKEQPKK